MGFGEKKEKKFDEQAAVLVIGCGEIEEEKKNEWPFGGRGCLAGLREKRKIKRWGLFGRVRKKKLGVAGKKIKTQQGLAADPL